MSAAVSLLSVLTAPASAGQAGLRTLSSEAAGLFAGMFAGGGQVAQTGEGDQVAVPETARATLLQRLDALGRRAAQAVGLGEEETLEEVADMASDLAEALADFDDSGAGGLGAMIVQMLPQAAAAEVDASAAAIDAGGTTTPAASAALDMFRGTLTLIGRALRDMPQAGETVEVAEAGQKLPQSRSFGAIPALPQLFEADLTAVEMVSERDIPAPLASPAPIRPVEPETTAVPSVDVAVEESEMTPEIALAPVPDEGAKAETGVADLSAGDIGDDDLILPVLSRRSEPTAAGGADLLGRIAAVAVTGAVASGDGAGAGTSDGNRRRLTVEDVLAALPQSGANRQGQAAIGADAAVRADAAEPPRFAEVLTEQIRAAEISDGHTRIELNPRGLGALEVDVSTADDGSLNVVVRAENPGVLQALKADRDLLAQALGALGGGALDLQSFSQGSDQRGSDQRSAPSMIASATESPAAAAAGDSAMPADQIGGGRLDIVT